MQEILFRAMGSEIYCAVDSTHARAAERLGQVPAMFEAWEKILSRFRPDSELSQLNVRTGEPVYVSEILGQVLELAKWAEEWSDGLVTSLVLDALEDEGYDKSFELMPSNLRGGQSTAPGTRTESVQMQPGRATSIKRAMPPVTVMPGARIDLGGVAKGWAAEQTANYLGELGPTLVDAGGDMVITAPCAAGSWQVGIENPFAPQEDESLPVLEIEQGAVATSGRDFRKWQNRGRPVHHLIDPRTGLAAVTDVLAATVVAPTIFQAEVAAKVVCILGSVQGMAWLDAHPGLAALAILEDGRVRMNSTMERRC